MPAVQETIDQVRLIEVDQYKYGFETEVEMEKSPRGLSEDVIRFISAKKGEPEWMLQWRFDAYKRWLTMKEPAWARVSYDKVDYNDIYYYAAPKKNQAPKSLDEVDPEILKTYEKLGIPLREQEILAGVEPERRVAVDAVFDSVSVATTFKEELSKAGVIFMPISEAIREYPDLVRQYMGTVVPVTDNFFATLNSAVFTDGSFVYIPPGVRCPMELSTYFRINEKNTGQFERTLIIADKGSYVSYLEGCTAPKRDENQLHAAVVELIALDDAEIKYSTVQNWYPGDAEGRGGIYNFVTKRGDCRGRNSVITWTQVETGSADHLEVPVLHPARRQFPRGVLLHRRVERHAAGGFRHQDDPSRPEHQKPDHLQGHRGGPVREHLSRPGLGPPQGHGRAQLHQLRLAPHRQPVRGPYGALHRVEERQRRVRARGDHVQDLRGSDVLLPAARPLGEEATALIVNGFVKDVLQQLPMEFAVEAQKLISISLEGSVG
jgi:Fe-S cluster assembly protein SufB